MFCISCGAKLPDDARFCAVCGAKVYNPDSPDDLEAADRPHGAGDSAPATDDADDVEDRAAAEEAENEEAGHDAPSPSEVSLRGKTRMKVKNPALRDGSGPLNLPEIDPSQPFASTPPAREGREDDISVSPDVTVVLPPGPFKPSYGPLSAADLFESDGTTAKMPRIETADGEVLVEGDSPVKNFVQSNTVPRRWTPLRVLLLVVMVAVALALAIAAIQLYGQRSQETAASVSQHASSSATSSSSTSSSAASSTASSSSQSARSEAQRTEALWSQLGATYRLIGDLNERMGDAVDDYNTYYAASDAAARRQAADSCNALSSDIAAAATDLSAFLDENGCTDGTTYYDQFQSQEELLDLLSQRVAPLVSSWERSVASSDPVSDESYILEPLAAVDSTTLVSRFDALYAQAAPVEE